MTPCCWQVIATAGSRATFHVLSLCGHHPWTSRSNPLQGLVMLHWLQWLNRFDLVSVQGQMPAGRHNVVRQFTEAAGCACSGPHRVFYEASLGPWTVRDKRRRSATCDGSSQGPVGSRGTDELAMALSLFLENYSML